MRKTILFALLCMILAMAGAAVAQYWNFPPAPPPEQYGNLLINRTSEQNGQRPVTFSHWSHRRKDTCRVCHFELGFEMKVNATEITEEACRKGQFCGACHDGKEVFGHTRENCIKCHNGNIAYGREKFKELQGWPKAPHGNRVDWVKALQGGLIRPRQSLLDPSYAPMPFQKDLTLEAAWTMIPPAYFSHEVHKQWLDCANCHPDIFNVKKKTTKHFAMKYNLEGKFCGACHLKVAFPLNDCQRCHPDIKG